MPNVFRVSVNETGFQQWNGYPSSPATEAADSRNYPYQIVAKVNGTYMLCCFTTPPWAEETWGSFSYHGITIRFSGAGSGYAWNLSGGVWVQSGGFTGITLNLRDYPDSEVIESNTTVYFDSGLTTTYFAQTTTPFQNAGIVKTLITVDTSDTGAFNVVPSTPDHQPWANYPDTPVLTVDYPCQAIIIYLGNAQLIVSSKPFFRSGETINVNASSVKVYNFSGGIYTQAYSSSNYSGALVVFSSISEANNNIFTDATLTTVYFAKTTA